MTNQRNYLPLRELHPWRILAVFSLLFVCFFFYRYLEVLAYQPNASPMPQLIDQGGGIVSAMLLFPIIYTVAIRFPLTTPAWRRNLLVHLLTAIAMSVAQTTMMALERKVLYPLAGLGAYDYGHMLVRYPMELAMFLFVYASMLAGLYLIYEIRFGREQELQQARLEASLAEAQLQNLRLQLHPHFLFNALNAVSAAVYEDPRRADEMIGRLSEMLRQLLKSDPAQQVPLAREMELLRLYTRIMEARFEDRLTVKVSLGADVEDALVPPMLLQPLVENAIRYGLNVNTLQACVTVTAARLNGRLKLSVEDTGPGFPEQINRGTGLRNISDRLEKIYGSAHTLLLSNAAMGGAHVAIALPFRAGCDTKTT